MTADAVPLDRRARRRQETIEEVLDIAVEIMTEQGVAGLSIGEVARRMGIRPPSLYVYFPSKEAIYDALFARGAREIGQLTATESEKLLDNAKPGQPLAEIMLDAAASQGPTSDTFALALLLRNRGVPVHVEPRPKVTDGQHWTAPALKFGVVCADWLWRDGNDSRSCNDAASSAPMPRSTTSSATGSSSSPASSPARSPTHHRRSSTRAGSPAH